MKTPDEIIKYRNAVIEVLHYAKNNGFITDEQLEIIKENVLDIELELYPKKMIVDENGNEHVESDYIYGKPFDEWE